MPALPNIPSVISIAELRTLLDKSTSNSPRVILLDVSIALPPHSEYTQYLESRLPGARFFSLKRWGSQPYKTGQESKGNALQGSPSIMLPTPSKFCAGMRYLGIKKDDHIVCYDTMGIWMTPRGAWMLKVYGHENVSLLNGGLPAWKAAGYPTESGPVAPVERSDYPYALPDKSLIKEYVDLAALNKNPEQRFLIDSRPPNEYADGHMPHSVPLPFFGLMRLPDPPAATQDSEQGQKVSGEDWLEASERAMNDIQGGASAEGKRTWFELLPREEWEAVVRGVLGESTVTDLIEGKNEGREVVITCGWGITACGLWLTLGQLGIPVSVYDESWEGYELRPGNPIMRGGVVAQSPQYEAVPTLPSSQEPAGSSEVAAGTTTGKLSFPELQIRLDDLEDDGTPDVGEVSA